MKLSTGDYIVASTAALATLCSKTCPAWMIAAAGQYVSELVDPVQPHPVVTIDLGNEPMGPLSGNQVRVLSKAAESLAHASGWLATRALVRKAPKPIAMVLGAASYVAMRQASQAAAVALDAKFNPAPVHESPAA